MGNGPSGVVRLTGPAVPTDLRGKFLICNYRGSSTRSEVLSISILSKGAGFELVEVTPFLSALNASDVELGYDGRIYFVEYGSGWAPDDKGSVQVAEPLAENLKKSGMDVARIIKDGFDHRPVEALIDLLGHMDLRVRQEAQFALVRKGSEVAFPPFSKIIEASESASLSQVHAIWGIGQLARLGSDKANRLLIETLKHPRVELRANAARLCGDLKVADAQPHLISVLNNDSPRVVSLSAIALGRVAKAGDSKVVDALLAVARKNQGENFDNYHSPRYCFCPLTAWPLPSRLSHGLSPIHWKFACSELSPFAGWSTRGWLLICKMLILVCDWKQSGPCLIPRSLILRLVPVCWKARLSWVAHFYTGPLARRRHPLWQ